MCWPETKEQLESLRLLHQVIFGGQGYIGTTAADEVVSAWFSGSNGAGRGAAQPPAGVADGKRGEGGAADGLQDAVGLIETAARTCDQVMLAVASMASSSPSGVAGAEPGGLAAPEPSGPLPEAEGDDGDPEGPSGWGATDFSELPEGLKAITAVRLQLPLRLAMAAYWDEAAFRAATGIDACRLVDDATYDAQVPKGQFVSSANLHNFLMILRRVCPWA